MYYFVAQIEKDERGTLRMPEENGNLEDLEVDGREILHGF
jgi:hypothetical protein